jgi:5-formyltetrahydrofolate cyclo-ligase
MKASLRKQLKSALAAVGPGEMVARSAQACRRLIATREFASARCIMLYLPMPAELDVTAAIASAWAAGKRVAVPKVDWDAWRIVPVRCDSFDNLVVGRYNLREPAGALPAPLDEIDLVVVPGLGFDRSGRRLGRGGGFYDRLLADSGLRAVLCGVCLDCQLVDHLPSEAHDRPVDMLVTDRELLRFGKELVS